MDGWTAELGNGSPDVVGKGVFPGHSGATSVPYFTLTRYTPTLPTTPKPPLQYQPEGKPSLDSLSFRSAAAKEKRYGYRGKERAREVADQERTRIYLVRISSVAPHRRGTGKNFGDFTATVSSLASLPPINISIHTLCVTLRLLYIYNK